MTAPTHIAFGLLTVASSFSLFSMSFHRNLPAVACAIIGSLLPDVDSPKSSIGRLMPFASIPIERRWGHRTITHSLLCMLALSVVTLPLLAYQSACYAAVLLGYMSHLIADSATKSGVPCFIPIPRFAFFLAARDTGSKPDPSWGRVLYWPWLSYCSWRLCPYRLWAVSGDRSDT